MIDINLIRNNKDKVEEALAKRMDNINLDEVYNLDIEKRKVGTKLDKLRNEKKLQTEKLQLNIKEKNDVTEIKNNIQNISLEIEKLTELFKDLENKIFNILAPLPNMPDEDVLAGGKENNKVIKTVKNKPNFSFDLIPHYELLKNKNMVDFERGVKLAGTKNWIYTGLGARLEWALINFFIDYHINNGFEFMMVPYMLNNECGYGAGQFPKFNDEVFKVKDGDTEKFLLPTAETALVNIHAKEILKETDLPKKYFAYTQCFRVEAGTSRVEERGTIRGNQFNKVEMVQYVKQEDTPKAFDELLNIAEDILNQLGLHYQVTKLAAGDCSAAMNRTYDLEVWIPSMKKYVEVSSVSSSGEYQARRNNTKYRDENGDLKYVNTLNASGLATSRLLPAIMEQFQNEDGTVTIPEVLRKYLSNIEKL